MTDITPHIFRAYDIRGRVPSELNPQISCLIGRALASASLQRGLNEWVHSYDGRLSSPELSRALVKGLVGGGMRVTNIGLGPTPLLYYAASKQPQQCGVMLTGSHNPSDYNGMKIMLGGETLAGESIANLRRAIETGGLPPAENTSKTTTADYSQAYITDALAACNPLERPLTIVVDAGNGAAGKLAPALYRAYGCKVIELHCEIDGRFPNHHPDPGKKENLRDLILAVDEHQADLGLAFDGDGDRLGIITNKGEVIFPDRALMVFAEDLLTRHPGAKVLLDVKCSPLVLQHIAAAGGNPMLCPTGHSLIKQAMKREGALLAGEMSGHMFLAENWNGSDDALLAGLRLLALISRFPGGAHQLFAAYPGWPGTAEINLSCGEERKWEIIELLKTKGDFGDGKLIDIDGIRIEYAQSWGLVRCSNTTPTLVLRFEGATRELLAATIKRFAAQLGRLAPELDLAPLNKAIANHAD